MALNLDTNKFLQIAGYNVIHTTESESYIHLRYKVLKKYNFTCQLCGVTAPSVPLQIAHIIPEYKNGKVEENNLTVLCYNCKTARLTSIQNEGLNNNPLFKRSTKAK